MGERAVEQERDEAVVGNGAHESGRYTIEPGTQVSIRPSPQPLAAGASNSAILAVHRISEEELEWIEERSSRRPRPANTQQLLPIAAEPSHPDDVPTLSALRPYYREPTAERVQLQFEDRSLDPSQNPLARSSLQPPPARALGNMHTLLTGVGALALIGVGYLAALASGSGREPVTSFAPASAPRIELVHPAHAQLDEANIRVGAASAVAVEPLWSSPDTAAMNAAPQQTPAPVAAPPPARVDAAAPVAPPVARRARAGRARQATARADAAPTTGLAVQPTRDEIKASVEATRAALQTCAGTNHGMTTAHITILGSGRVAAANIEGAFAGTPQGSCMARALRGSVFPRFSAPTLQVTYPFRL